MPSSPHPIDAVLQYVEAFNNGDSTAMAASCADPMQILDGMSPHVWQGPTAAEDWWTDVLSEGEHLRGVGLPHRTRRAPPCGRRWQFPHTSLSPRP